MSRIITQQSACSLKLEMFPDPRYLVKSGLTSDLDSINFKKMVSLLVKELRRTIDGMERRALEIRAFLISNLTLLSE